MTNLQQHFLLDPSIHFLNHGSFGAAPKPVFESYQRWQRRLESQPVFFLGREHNSLLKESRTALGAFLNTDADDLVYIPNATHGVNIIARSIRLQASDEVLTTDHEYGACDFTWDFLCGKIGAKYIHQPIALPAESEDRIIDQFWLGVTQRTKIIYLSHITSPTALRLPVEKICARARAQGILTLVDGAHAPGQIDLDLQSIGADFYTGNLHKWLMAPKGAAFLYARREVQHLVEPLIVSWGYGNDPALGSGSRFVDLFQWTGTHDPAAYLAVPDAIQFLRDHHWDQVRGACHQALKQTIERVCDLVKMPSAYPLESDFYAQMGIAPLPAKIDVSVLKVRLYDEHKIEIPLIAWKDRKFARISIQGYNTPDDTDALIEALRVLL
jgi:isopenicillin-N epimerase